MEARVPTDRLTARLVGAVALVLASGVAAACAPVTPSAVVSPSPRGDETPTGAPTGGPVVDLQVTGEALPAGRYRSSGFEPEITIALDGTWQAFNLLDGFFDLGHLPDGDDMTLVQFARVDGVFARSGSMALKSTSAAQAVAMLASNSSLHVIETSASRIGGLVGTQATIEAATPSDWPVLLVSGSPVVVEEGKRLRIAFFDTPKGLLAIMVSGRIDRWDAALSTAAPILESVTIRSID